MVTVAIEETLEHALFLARHFDKCDLQYVIVAVLIELKVPTNRIGFEYLKRSIMMFCDNPSQMITKDIYPAVGNIDEAKANKLQVEQNIRSAISDAWKNRDESVWKCYFFTLIDSNGKLKKPSNAEFISGIGRFLELWQGCCKEVNNEQ